MIYVKNNPTAACYNWLAAVVVFRELIREPRGSSLERGEPRRDLSHLVSEKGV